MSRALTSANDLSMMVFTSDDSANTLSNLSPDMPVVDLTSVQAYVSDLILYD